MNAVECWSVISNPLAYYQLVLFRVPRRLHFRNGFVLACNARNLRVAKNLIALGGQGARFASNAVQEEYLWGVRPAENLLETPSGLRFRLDSMSPVVFSETFLYDVHFQGFDLSDKVVIDVGANVGDTALYFAQRGATVHAFEPDPENYRMLLDNISLNPELSGRITPHPIAVGRDGAVTFRSGLGGGSGMHAPSGREIRVESWSLRRLMANLGLQQALLLKADCKGCEFELVRQPEIASFDRLAIEYVSTYGDLPVDGLVSLLRSRGFSQVRVAKHNGTSTSLDRHGTLFAGRG